jgi:hypothetical protein
MIKPYSLLLLLLTNCNSNKNCTITISELIKTNNNKLFVIEDESNKSIFTLRDKGNDSLKGGEYSFNEKKILKSYKFFKTKNAYSYNEEFDSDGNLIKTEGRPLVDKKIREVNKDSAIFYFYFFSLNKEYNGINISLNNENIWQNVSPHKDTLYSNMSVVSLKMNTRNLKQFKIYLHVTYYDACKSKIEEFADSILLIKTPYLNLDLK